MAMNVIQQAASEGRPTFGVWSAAPSQAGAEILGRSGIDWVLLDLQHGSANEGDLLPLIQAIELGGSSALIRVGWADPQLIMRAMDLGAIGVVVPMVSTPGQAEVAARSMRYPPLGDRSFGPLRRPFNPNEAADAPHTCVVMVETVDGLANVDAIAATPGVDVVLVGPVDLGLALGLGLDVTGSHPTLVEAMREVVAACNRHGKVAGGVALRGENNAEMLLELGMRFVTLGSDAGYLAQGIAADVARAQQLATSVTG
jgi:4-hydroxy-2-oxoheptanedioate aldolase